MPIKIPTPKAMKVRNAEEIISKTDTAIEMTTRPQFITLQSNVLSLDKPSNNFKERQMFRVDRTQLATLSEDNIIGRDVYMIT